MGAGKVLALIAGLLTLIGTYVVAIYGIAGSYAGSGIGFILNIPDLFSNAATYATGLSIEIWLFYILVIVFIIFLAAGLLQIIFMKSRIFSILWSLFPLGVSLMFLLLVYTDILGIKSAFFILHWRSVWWYISIHSECRWRFSLRSIPCSWWRGARFN